MKPEKWFAWHPVKMPDGQWIWRQWILRTEVHYEEDLPLDSSAWSMTQVVYRYDYEYLGGL